MHYNSISEDVPFLDELQQYPSNARIAHSSMAQSTARSSRSISSFSASHTTPQSAGPQNPAASDGEQSIRRQSYQSMTPLVLTQTSDLNKVGENHPAVSPAGIRSALMMSLEPTSANLMPGSGGCSSDSALQLRQNLAQMFSPHHNMASGPISLSAAHGRVGHAPFMGHVSPNKPMVIVLLLIANILVVAGVHCP